MVYACYIPAILASASATSYWLGTWFNQDGQQFIMNNHGNDYCNKEGINMAWAWFEGQNIFVAYSKEVAPENAIEVPDSITPQDLVVENGQLRLKTEQERLNEIKQYKLQELKTYMANLLAQTDWVIAKLQSMVNEGWADEEIQAERQKYEPVFKQRREIREWAEQMKKLIKEAKTVDEVLSLEIVFKENMEGR